MKRNTFYIIAGIVGLVLVGIFWLSVEIHNPTLITVAFIAGIILLYGLRTRISDRIEDERTILITQKSAMRTLEVFWVVFFAISLGGAVFGLGAPGFPKPPHRPPDEGLIPLGHLGFMQMTLLCLMIFLYVGFRMYYARQYGEWDTDEEQD
ncbi:MAG: DUF2178 domain-containing protein [Methanoregulaceae archaeon]|nr:DUF2178 domain-containing protein [Methanoregulaceae archaeon]